MSIPQVIELQQQLDGLHTELCAVREEQRRGEQEVAQLNAQLLARDQSLNQLAREKIELEGRLQEVKQQVRGGGGGRR